MIDINEYTPEEQHELREFADASEEDKKCILFDSFMSLLTKAIADDDSVMIKSCARLATEIWNDIHEGEEQ